MTNKAKRKQIAEDNLKIMKVGFYKKYDILQDMANSCDETKVYSEEALNEIVQNQTEAAGEKNVVAVTKHNVVTDVLAMKEKYPGSRVAVLNFASARNAGGGFLNGSLSQEETLSYASTLFGVLKDQKAFYKNPKHHENGLYSHSMIYSPNVLFIRDEKHALIEPLKVDVITSVAVNVKDLKDKKQTNELKMVEAVMTERIERVFALAKSQGVEVLILGAFGCGVFDNNPYSVSKIFQAMLNKPAYKGIFKEVVFSIYESDNSNRLFNIFKTIR